MAEFPAINGYAYSWASIELVIARSGDSRRITRLISEVSYGESRDRGMGRGTSGRKSLRTQGDSEYESSITFFKHEWDALVAEMGDGFMDEEFNLVVSYADKGRPVVTDTIERCLINAPSVDASEGPDPVTVECELDVMDILWNGKRGRKPPPTE